MQEKGLHKQRGGRQDGQTHLLLHLERRRIKEIAPLCASEAVGLHRGRPTQRACPRSGPPPRNGHRPNVIWHRDGRDDLAQKPGEVLSDVTQGWKAPLPLEERLAQAVQLLPEPAVPVAPRRCDQGAHHTLNTFRRSTSHPPQHIPPQRIPPQCAPVKPTKTEPNMRSSPNKTPNARMASANPATPWQIRSSTASAVSLSAAWLHMGGWRDGAHGRLCTYVCLHVRM